MPGTMEPSPIQPLHATIFRVSQFKFRPRILHGCTEELERDKQNFEIERQFYLSEAQLILGLVLDNDETLVRQMMKDDKHPEWRNPDLETRARERFNLGNCLALKAMVDNIRGTIDTIDQVKIADKFPGPISKFRETNSDLRVLRGVLTDRCKSTTESPT